MNTYRVTYQKTEEAIHYVEAHTYHQAMEMAELHDQELLEWEPEPATVMYIDETEQVEL